MNLEGLSQGRLLERVRQLEADRAELRAEIGLVLRVTRQTAERIGTESPLYRTFIRFLEKLYGRLAP